MLTMTAISFEGLGSSSKLLQVFWQNLAPHVWMIVVLTVFYATFQDSRKASL